METLVQMAKRLGIKPNSHMTDDDYKRIQDLMIQELKKIGKTSEDHLDAIIYDFHKKTPSGIAQHFDHTAFESNFSRFVNETLPGVTGFDQDGSFWWHDAREKGVHAKERFVADLKLDDPNMPEIFKKLDEFILRHKSAYKVVSSGNRTDTLNLYLPKEVTSEIAKEFYEIVKPVLQEKNHQYLDGYPIQQGGKEIKGIKFGPEPLHDVSMKEDFEPMKKRLESILPRTMLREVTRQYCGKKSLGQVSAKVQLCDLLYYLVGREGQNPIQLGNQLGDPKKYYSKTSIDIVHVECTTVCSSVVKKPTSASRMSHSVVESTLEKAPEVKTSEPVFCVKTKVPVTAAPVPTSVESKTQKSAGSTVATPIPTSKEVATDVLPATLTPSDKPLVFIPPLTTKQPLGFPVDFLPDKSNSSLTDPIPSNFSIKDLLRELSSLTAEIRSIRSEVFQVKQKNAQLREIIERKTLENVQLRAEVKTLREQAQAKFSPTIAKVARRNVKN